MGGLVVEEVTKPAHQQGPVGRETRQLNLHLKEIMAGRVRLTVRPIVLVVEEAAQGPLVETPLTTTEV
jgi:hypothetical protein